MAQYWHDRMQEALDRSLSAPNASVREVHLRTAEHYRLLRGCFLRQRLAHANPASAA